MQRLGLLDHIDHGVGHNAVKAVVTVLVGVSTGQLHNIQVVLVDGSQRGIHATDDVAHRAQGDLHFDGVLNTGLEIELIILQITVLIQCAVVEQRGLPVGI